MRRFDVPEVLEVHEIPSVEVRMVPDAPTTKKVLFAYVTPLRKPDDPEVLEVHEVPFVEVRMFPDAPTTTKVLFPYVTP